MSEAIHCPGCGDDRIGDGIEECDGVSEPSATVVMTDIRDLLGDLVDGQAKLIEFLEETVQRLTSNPLIALGMKRRRDG